MTTEIPNAKNIGIHLIAV